MKKASQLVMILSYLKKGNGLTPLEAVARFGCMRLASRVLELRKQGYDIKKEMTEENGKRYACYFIEK